jgi:hypothetical protein
MQPQQQVVQLLLQASCWAGVLCTLAKSLGRPWHSRQLPTWLPNTSCSTRQSQQGGLLPPLHSALGRHTMTTCCSSWEPVLCLLAQATSLLSQVSGSLGGGQAHCCV